MSSTELYREISGLVFRALKGEAVDTVSAGSDLAARFPDLGMPGDLIAKAIARAAGMMGISLEGAETLVSSPGLAPEEPMLGAALGGVSQAEL